MIRRFGYVYRKPIPTQLQRITTPEGERIEQKVRRIVEDNEPIKDGAPEIYTERGDGVLAAYNIRTDRFEVAVEAMDKVTRSRIAQSDARAQNAESGKVIDIQEGSKGSNDGGETPANAR